MTGAPSLNDSSSPVGARFSGRSRVLLVCVSLVIATVALYAPTGGYDYIRFDDPRYVSENPFLEDGITFEMIQWAMTSNYKSNWHPLTWMSHGLDIELFGIDPGPHHLMNLLIHVLNTLLVFAFLYSATGQLWRCGFVAGVFAIHPMHIESVAWISERKDVLSTFFGLISLWAYVGYARLGGWRRFTGVFAALFFGLMAKSMVVTLPFVFLLLDYWPLRRMRSPWESAANANDPGRGTVIALVREKVPLFVLVAAASFSSIWAQSAGGALRSSSMIAVSDRVANAVVVYVLYVFKSIWPTGLAVHYPHPNLAIIGGSPRPSWQLAGAIALLTTICISTLLLQKHRYVFVGWFWFVGMLIPTIGLVQVGTQSHADRYVYLPMVGLSIAIVWGFGEWAEQWSSRSSWRRRAIWLIAACVLGSFWIASARHLPTWRNSESVFEQALAVNPTNAVILTNLGNEMFDRGDYDSAIAYYRRAIKIAPTFALPRKNLKVALEDRDARSEASRDPPSGQQR